MSNVPQLRFQEFSREWKLNPLSKVSEMKAGKFVKASNISDTQENEMYPCYGGNGLRGYVTTQTHEGTYSLIGRQGALCGNVQLASGKFHATEHAVVVTPTDDNDTLWLYYELDRLNLNRFATGQAQPGLSVEVIQQVKTNVPSKQEQEKIASFLTSADTKIEQLTKKEKLLQQYKKGVMQKIFNQEIRFKADDGSEFSEWRKRKLKDIATKKNAKNKDSKIKAVLTNSAKFGIVNQQDYFDKDIANQNNLEGYYIVEEDDFVYNPRISTLAPVGPMKRNKVGKGVMSPLYSVLEMQKEYTDFYELYFNTALWHKYMNQIANFGARHDRMNVTNNDFMKMPLPFPCVEEQKKVVTFLSAITQKVKQAQKQLEQTKELKKALLQQMFV